MAGISRPNFSLAVVRSPNVNLVGLQNAKAASVAI